MKKAVTGILTICLLASLSVCGAEQLAANHGLEVSCKGGVCEFAPGNAGGITASALDANVNPYRNAVPDIEAKWARDVQPGPHDEFTASTSEPQVGIVFFVNNPVKNFKVLSLSFKDMGADGKPVFLIKELYTKDVLRPERPLLVKTSLFGSIPNNGISYVDANGKTRYYTVSESGMDGSVTFSEF